MNDSFTRFLHCHPDIAAQFLLWLVEQGQLTPADLSAIIDRARAILAGPVLAEFERVAEAFFEQWEQ